MLEYNNNWYNEDFHSGENEKEIDQFLAFINYICYLRNMKIIKENEFKLLRYEVNRVCCNYGVQSYLWNLFHFSIKMNAKCSFNEIIDYGMKKKLLPQQFKQNNKDLFPKYLNF